MKNLKQKYFSLIFIIFSLALVENVNAGARCGSFFSCIIKGKTDIVGTKNRDEIPPSFLCQPEGGMCQPPIRGDQRYEGKCQNEKQCAHENLCKQWFPARCSNGECRGSVLCQTLN